MDKFCDLHTHSFYSDGTFSPAEIIAEAEKLGLSFKLSINGQALI